MFFKHHFLNYPFLGVFRGILNGKLKLAAAEFSTSLRVELAFRYFQEIASLRSL
jgi:hypothetical protein